MTDIHVPHADGIAVTAHVKEHYPDIVVVPPLRIRRVRARAAAIRNKVFDYVLKPVSSRDLTTLLAKIKDRLNSSGVLAKTSPPCAEGGLLDDILRERSFAEFLTGVSPLPDASEAAGSWASGRSCSPARPCRRARMLDASRGRLRRGVDSASVPNQIREKWRRPLAWLGARRPFTQRKADSPRWSSRPTWIAAPGPCSS